MSEFNSGTWLKKELAAKRMRFGYRRLTVLLAREGLATNHKRVYRLYRGERLAMRIRQRRRLRWSVMQSKPTAVNKLEVVHGFRER